MTSLAIVDNVKTINTKDLITLERALVNPPSGPVARLPAAARGEAASLFKEARRAMVGKDHGLASVKLMEAGEVMLETKYPEGTGIAFLGCIREELRNSDASVSVPLKLSAVFATDIEVAGIYAPTNQGAAYRSWSEKLWTVRAGIYSAIGEYWESVGKFMGGQGHYYAASECRTVAAEVLTSIGKKEEAKRESTHAYYDCQLDAKELEQVGRLADARNRHVEAANLAVQLGLHDQSRRDIAQANRVNDMLKAA